MDLAGVQAAVRAIHPFYPNCLNWQQDGDVIKAFPKSYMSQAAFDQVKALFKRLGGEFVMHGRDTYFELVLRAEQNRFRHATSNNQTSQDIVTQPNVSPVPGSVLLRLQAHLERIGNAAVELP